jgi:imidazolonepropionase-like amidohydrolase
MLEIAGATIIDAVSEEPIEGHSVWVVGNRIEAIAPRGRRGAPGAAPTKTLDARGKYVIPGLMDANVHLLLDMRLENLVRYEGRYEELIAEAAQVALRSGLTTVFDTWGPRRDLMRVRDRIHAGEIPGSRIFCAGNIIGLDGPFSKDFLPDTLKVASAELVERINSRWAENVGPALSWMTAEQVAEEVRAYIQRGIDFVKYASTEHRANDPSAFLLFSPHAQAAIVREAHRAGLTAQAHTSSVEGLRAAVESGANIIQHGNVTGPTPIPRGTLQLIAERGTAVTVFAFTKRRTDWIMEQSDAFTRSRYSTLDLNIRSLVQSGARILLATDAGVVAPEWDSDPLMSRIKAWANDAGENLGKLGEGHFHWMKAMQEKEVPPLQMLRSATRNIAVAYGKHDLGTLEQGKIADMLILDRNPLEAAENYRSIHTIIKDGQVVDRAALPLQPVLTRPLEPPSPEAVAYRAQRNVGGSRGPCPCP